MFEHDGEFLLTANGSVPMTTRLKSSEEELARLGVTNVSLDGRVLIGGLGFGFTLRATPDRLPATTRVIQAELVPEIVEWNRGPLGARNGDPLRDPRVELVVDDVKRVIRRHHGDLDAIILDIDNAPSPARRRHTTPGRTATDRNRLCFYMSNESECVTFPPLRCHEL